MATKAMSYDHPAYIAVGMFGSETAVGANGVTDKFAAFTALKLKSIQYTPRIASTAAGSQPLLYTKSGTATATQTLTALTSAAVATFNSILSDLAMAAGDICWVTHGTDATAAMAVGIEYVVTPGATVTA